MPVTPGRFLYFAYGSNLLSEWMCSAARCPSATRVGPALVTGFDLAFSKRSKDGSGKATLIKSADPRAWVEGAVYSIADGEREALRRTEFRYDEHATFPVRLRSGGEAITVTYIAPPSVCDEALRPFGWYLDLVVLGGRQSNLSPDYVERLARNRFVADADPERLATAAKVIDAAKRAMVNARR